MSVFFYIYARNHHILDKLSYKFLFLPFLLSVLCPILKVVHLYNWTMFYFQKPQISWSNTL